MSVTKKLSYGKPIRVWVNAPSTLQTYHEFHGRNGLAISEDDTMAQLFFCEGPIISMRIDTLYLSLGWR
jgi:hypothetical protein